MSTYPTSKRSCMRSSSVYFWYFALSQTYSSGLRFLW